MADGYNIACPSHIQVGPREGNEARVSHCMLVPTQHITQSEAGAFHKVAVQCTINAGLTFCENTRQGGGQEIVIFLLSPKSLVATVTDLNKMC